MVKVKLMENRVKSHVGRVMVVKVMIQYSVPGSTVRTVRIARARTPNVEGFFSVACRVAMAVGMLVGFNEAEEELFAMALTASAEAAMVE
jgi:hypothetical protein